MPIYNLTCNGCGTSVDVGHPDPAHPQYDPDALAKLAAPDAAVACPPDSGCCQEPGCAHDQACEGGHDGPCAADGQAAVANPDCGVCKSLTITAFEGAAVLGGSGF